MCGVSYDLVGGRQQRFRDGEAERPRGLEVDDEFDFCQLLHRQVGWFLAFQNAPGIDANLVVETAPSNAIAYQAAGQGELTKIVDRGQRMAGRQGRELLRAPGEESAASADQDRTNMLLGESCEGRFEIAIGAGIHNDELQAQRGCRRLQVCDDGWGSRNGRVHEYAEHDSIGYSLAEQL